MPAFYVIATAECDDSHCSSSVGVYHLLSEIFCYAWMKKLIFYKQYLII